METWSRRSSGWRPSASWLLLAPGSGKPRPCCGPPPPPAPSPPRRAAAHTQGRVREQNQNPPGAGQKLPPCCGGRRTAAGARWRPRWGSAGRTAPRCRSPAEKPWRRTRCRSRWASRRSGAASGGWCRPAGPAEPQRVRPLDGAPPTGSKVKLTSSQVNCAFGVRSPSMVKVFPVPVWP